MDVDRLMALVYELTATVANAASSRPHGSLTDAYAAVRAAAQALALPEGWQPIETAPFEADPLGHRPPDRLLYGPSLGIQKGQVWRWAHGTVASVPHLSGQITEHVTHWMPIPAVPQEPRDG